METRPSLGRSGQMANARALAMWLPKNCALVPIHHQNENRDRSRPAWSLLVGCAFANRLLSKRQQPFAGFVTVKTMLGAMTGSTGTTTAATRGEFEKAIGNSRWLSMRWSFFSVTAPPRVTHSRRAVPTDYIMPTAMPLGQARTSVRSSGFALLPSCWQATVWRKSPFRRRAGHQGPPAAPPRFLSQIKEKSLHQRYLTLGKGERPDQVFQLVPRVSSGHRSVRRQGRAADT